MDSVLVAPVRDFVLLCAGKKLRGESLSENESSLLRLYFGSFSDLTNPIFIECQACHSEIVVFDDSEAVESGRFLRTESGDLACGCAGRRLRFREIALH
jgi:hypothetical protein